MAREIVVEVGGATSRFSFKKLDRKKLYGSRRRIALDGSGEPCENAALTRDGRFLLRVGMTALAYFADDDTWVPSGDLVGIDPTGVPVDKRPSTLGSPEVAELVPPQALLDLHVTSVYQLDAAEVDPGLTASLEAGSIYRFPFSYRGGFKTDTACLVANAEGVFALIGQEAPPEWAALDAISSAVFDDDDDFDDALDFEMF